MPFGIQNINIMNDNLNINDALQQVPQLKTAIDNLRGLYEKKP